jgi:hypothetical protein
VFLKQNQHKHKHEPKHLKGGRTSGTLFWPLCTILMAFPHQLNEYEYELIV